MEGEITMKKKNTLDILGIKDDYRYDVLVDKEVLYKDLPYDDAVMMFDDTKDFMLYQKEKGKIKIVDMIENECIKEIKI